MSLPMTYVRWDDEETADTILGSGCLSEYPWWVDVKGYNEEIGKSFTITSWDETGQKKMVTEIRYSQLRAIARAIVAGKHGVNDRIINDIKRDDIDADSADCILQIAVFGQVVYG